MMEEKTARRWLVGILALALVLRVGAALYMGDQVQVLPGIHDQLSYDALARSVLAGRGFTFEQDWYPFTRANTPTAHWSFGYVMYLVGVYGLFGYHPLVARLIQVTVGGIAMILLVYRLGRRLFNPTVGLVAPGLAAVYAYLVYYAAALLTETFYMVALLVALDAALDLAASPSWKKWTVLGMALGAAAVLRQVVLLFIPVLLLWLLWQGRPRVKVWHPLLPLALIGLWIAPWTIRNYLVYDHFLLLNSNSGYALWASVHPVQGTNFYGLNLAPLPPELRGLNEAQMNDILTRQGFQFILDDPLRYLLLTLNKAKDQFIFWPAPQSGLLSNIMRVGSFGLALPLMLYGLFLARRSWRRCLLLLLFAVVYNAIHLLTWPAVRYRLPVDAVMLLYAAVAVVHIAGWLLARRRAVRPAEESGAR